MEEKEIKKDLGTTDATSNAVQVIKAAILQSQQRALKAINQEQLALYYGFKILLAIILGTDTEYTMGTGMLLNWSIVSGFIVNLKVSCCKGRDNN